MIDELTRAPAREPWTDERIPPGLDAKRVYEHAIAVGSSRRRRRRRGYAVGLAVLTVVVALSAMRELAPAPAARLGPGAQKAEATADSSTLAALKAKQATGTARHVILAVGASVMLGASTALETEIPSLLVDAKINRGIADAAPVLQQYRTAGVLPATVVIGLATNGTFTDAQFEAMMRVLGQRHAIFLNALMPRPWESEVNRALASNVGKYRNARLLNWNRIGRAHPGWFVGDGTHLNPTGVRAYSSLIRVSVLAPR